jgi:ubiquinone/menaquinone biosynthesis C-methylase UbiE
MPNANHRKKPSAQKQSSVPTSWGNVSDWYVDHLSGTDTYHAQVIIPNLMRLLKVQPGLRVLDVACGEGLLVRALASAGAVASGCDIAPELIAAARARHAEGVYHIAPADQLTGIHDESVDWVTIVLALQNIERYQAAIAEALRVTVIGGSVALVLNHPAFRIPRRTEWGWDQERHVQYRRVDGYLSESRSTIAMHPGTPDGPTTVSFHRPLQNYMKAIEKAGGVVTRIEEWISHRESGAGPRKHAEDRARAEFPLFMLIVVSRLG